MVDNWLARPWLWKSYILLTLGKLGSIVWLLTFVNICITCYSSSPTHFEPGCTDPGLIFWWYFNSLLASRIATMVLELTIDSFSSVLRMLCTYLFVLEESDHFFDDVCEHKHYFLEVVDMYFLYFGCKRERGVVEVEICSTGWQLLHSLGVSAAHSKAIRVILVFNIIIVIGMK